MKIKITKANIEKIKKFPIGIYRDSELIGFAVRVTATKQTYIIDKKLNNKVVRKVIGNIGALTPDEARKQAQVLLGQLAKGVDVNIEQKKEKAKGVTLLQAYNDYVSTKRLSKTTIIGYDSGLNVAFNDWRDKEITKINRDMIERRFKECSKKSPVSANLYFRLLRALFNFAMEKYCVDGEPIIPSNPCNRLKTLKLWNEVKPRDRYIKPSQIKMFFHALAVDDGDSEYIKTVKQQCMFILFTGARDQEAASLKCGNIDFTDNTVTFENTKNHHKHILPFGNWLGEFLKGLCDGKKPNDYIFPANNKYGHLKDLRKAIRQIAQDCGIAFSLHDLRRTFASMVESDLPFTVSEYLQNRLLNHVQSDVHGKHYIRYDIEVLREPMQAVENYILTQAGIKEPVKDDKVIKIDDARKKA